MKFKGFALFEIAIALAIMGMMIGLSLPMLTKLIKYNQIQTTNTNQEIVLSALGAYAVRNLHIPCPARNTQGIAQTTCDESSSQGIIPYATLNISRSYAVDGFGRFMTYAITPEFSQNAQKYCDIENPSSPVILAGMPYFSSNPIVVMLISHGSKGHGAFNGNFDRIRLPSPKGNEEENGNGDNIFIDASSSFERDQTFDHIIKWASQDLFAQYYMKTPCPRSSTTPQFKKKPT